jgi:3-hydroxyacyl-CoA dehydrogenase
VPITDRLCEAGRLGRKSGRGWYGYASGEANEDPEVTRPIEAASHARGLARRTIGADEIVEQLLNAMANEGARILDEGIVPRASDIDLVLVNGYGFPAHRGGPMFWVDRTEPAGPVLERRPSK